MEGGVVAATERTGSVTSRDPRDVGRGCGAGASVGRCCKEGLDESCIEEFILIWLMSFWFFFDSDLIS
jgi:hypothetical protein